MKKILLLITLLSIILVGDEIKVIKPKPKALISYNKPSYITITYEAKYTGADECKAAYSNTGYLEITPLDIVLKTINKKIAINLKKVGSTYIGKKSETIYVPYSVIQKVIKLGYQNSGFKYKRRFDFTNCISTDIPYGDVFLDIKITTPSALPLKINRVRLFFKNNKAVTTVNKNETLKAFAEIETFGKGLLKAHWEIDGRILSRIYKHINNQGKFVFETPNTPPLPTFSPGTHFLRFVIDEPEPNFEEPTALYFVKAEKLTNRKIVNLSPKDKSKMEIDKLNFSWNSIPNCKIYLIEFFKLGEDKPLFSAYSKTNSYSIPENIKGKIFKKGGYYSWRVVGYDEQDSIVGESDQIRFVIK